MYLKEIKNPKKIHRVMQDFEKIGLSAIIEQYMHNYFEALSGTTPVSDLHGVVMGEVEKPVLEVTLRTCQYNQKKAASILGINRNTLRRKINEHNIQIPSRL